MLANFNDLVNDLTLEDYQSMSGPDWPSFEQLKSGDNVPQFVIDELSEMFSSVSDSAESVKTFCVLPFYGIEYPWQISCCLMSRHDTIDRVQQDMLSGKRAGECSHCWKNEDYGLISDRQVKNASLDFYTKKDITKLFEECKSNKNEIRHYKIDTSNICNAACVTCNSKYSSLWLSYEKQNNIHKNKVWSIDSPNQLNINYAQAVSIGFRGGESTLSKTNFKILENLAAHGNTDCFISFTTNGSFNLTEQQLNLLKQFSNVSFCFSIDGLNKVFEYMRNPLSWNTILHNIDFCRNHNFMVSVSYTLSNVNIFYYQQTTKWFESNNLEYLVTPVQSPVWFRPGALSRDAKRRIIDHNQNLSISKLLESHSGQDDQDYAVMKQEITKQDQWKGISVADYLPEFAELIK